MRMKTAQVQRIKTYAHDVWVKFGLYPAKVEDAIYEYMREAMPAKLRRTLEDCIAVDDYLDQLDIYIERAENRFGKDLARYLSLKNLEVKPEGLITPEEFAMKMQECSDLAVKHGEEETAHGTADQLMTDTLTALGYKEGCDIFDDMPKWYA